MKKILFTVLLFSSVLLYSCSSVAYLRLMNITMGMTETQVFKILESDNYNEKDVQIINDVKKDFYDISSKVNTGKKINVLITHKYYEGQKGNETPFYLFAFEDGKLIYWGLPVEFNRSDKKDLNNIGKAAVEIIDKSYISKD